MTLLKRKKKPVVGTTKKVASIPAWEKLMRCFNPAAYASGGGMPGKQGRPRRWTLHGLAGVLNVDPLKLLAELKASGKVVGYCCPDVAGSPIFYLKELRSIMIDTANDRVWDQAVEFLKKYPFPATKGFRRFARAGQPVNMPSAFDPSDPEDAKYEVLVKEALAA